MMRFLLVLATLPLVACGSMAKSGDSSQAATSSGGAGTRKYQIADFTGIELAGADDIDVKVGGAFSVRAEGPAEELDKLDIHKDGAMLKVGRKRDGRWSMSSDKGVTVYVTMPAIAAASLRGSGNLSIDKVQAKAFDGSLAGSGDLKLGQLAVSSASLNIAGSGGIDAAGRVQQLKVAIAGSGDVDASGLKAAQADISIAGSGNVAAEVNGPARISLMGSGDVTLGGKPQCNTSKMGSGEVKCG